MPTLLALFGPKRGVRVDLEKALVVGRSSTADLQLVDEKVSREHCRFTTAGAEVRVEDLGSNNGTWVNGEKITGPRALKPGDEVAVGDSLFQLDAELDVASARYGDATLLVSPPQPGGPKPRTAADTGTPLPVLTALARQLAQASDPEAAARAVLAAMEEALSPDRAFVLLWDPLRKQATPLVGKSDGSAVAISRTVLEAAESSRRAVVLEDAVEDRALKDAKSVVRHHLRSVLVAPVLSGEATMAFLHADKKTKAAYGPTEAALLESLASLAALHGLSARKLPPAAKGAKGFTPPVGESGAFKEALRMASSAAGVPSTVLITGESGTGKEELARFIHERSPRAGKPFVAVNCGAIPETLAESELFGHEKGAFTGAASSATGKVEAADGGTLFLDEIGELSPAAQVKLLRVLQERAFYRVGSTVPRRVDIRILAATHRDLEADVKSGRFRADLYYRINVIRIHLPPLRERPEDLGPLARTLLSRLCMTLGRRDHGIASEGLQELSRHPWPGNGRELSNVLERVLVLRSPLSEGPISKDEIRQALGAATPGSAETSPGGTLDQKIAELEKVEIERALRAARGVKARAAEALGISRPTLDKKIADLAIDLWQEKA